MVLASLPPALGNAHLLLLHLPIGLVAAACMLEIWTWRDDAGRRLVQKILAVNVALTVLTAAAGLALAEQGGYAETTLARHRWAGVICAGVAALAWWLRARRGLLAGRVGLAALALATAVAGHLGGTLTHGDGLFAWSRPERKSAPRVMDPAVAGSAEKEKADPAAVHSLLVRSCVECHGEDKQKGRLRLDTLASAKAAGKSGELAVVPGKPEASEALRRILLPRDDEEAMPPADSDAKPLSEAEKAELARWIAALPMTE